MEHPRVQCCQHMGHHGMPKLLPMVGQFMSQKMFITMVMITIKSTVTPLALEQSGTPCPGFLFPTEAEEFPQLLQLPRTHCTVLLVARCGVLYNIIIVICVLPLIAIHIQCNLHHFSFTQHNVKMLRCPAFWAGSHQYLCCTMQCGLLTTFANNYMSFLVFTYLGMLFQTSYI